MSLNHAALPIRHHFALALLLLLALAVSTAPPAAAQPVGSGFAVALPLIANGPAQPPISVWVALGSNSAARPGDRVRLNISMRNDGRTEARGITLRVPFDPAIADFFTFAIDTGRGDRFLGVSNGNNVGLEINRPIVAGQTYAVSLWFTIRSRASAGQVLRLASDFTFGTRSGRTNLVTVHVLNSGEIAGGYCGPFRGVDGRMSVSPESGPSGTRFSFSSECFLPGEEVVTWLNTPGGVQPLALRDRADSRGRVAFQLDSRSLAPADSYGLVASGRTSGLQVLGPFIVRGLRATDAELPAARAAILAALAGEPPAAPAQVAGGVAGRVTGEDGAGLNDVVVAALNSDGAITNAGRSDASGAYRIEGLADGDYTIMILASLSADPASAAYASQLRQVSVSGGAVVPLDVTLSRGGFITGRVTGAVSGSPPLEGVSVFVYNDRFLLSGIGLTDANGVYTTTALLSGPYRVEFDPTLSLVITATNYLSATVPAVVGAPNTTTGVDAALAFAGDAIRIGGRVTAQDSGLPLANVTIAVTSADTGDILEMTTTNTFGHYQTSELPPGRFRVSALTTYADTALVRRYLGATYAEVIEQTTAGSRNGIDLSLVLGTQVSGTVTAADTGAPLPGVSVSVVTADGAVGVVVATTQTAADGTYETPAVPNGTYIVRFATDQSEDALTPRYRDAAQRVVVGGTGKPLFINIQLERLPVELYLPVASF